MDVVMENLESHCGLLHSILPYIFHTFENKTGLTTEPWGSPQNRTSQYKPTKPTA